MDKDKNNINLMPAPEPKAHLLPLPPIPQPQVTPPVVIPPATSLPTLKQMYSNGRMAFKVMTDGALYATGINTFGQLGLGDNISRDEFVKVEFSHNVTRMEFNANSTYLFADDNLIYVCGENNFGQLGLYHRDNQHTFVPLHAMILT